METTFNANDIVIAKVKGYPPWPAIVVNEEDLPEKIPPKPKSFESAPILFFNDNTYKWAAEADLKPLEADVALKHSQKTKTKKALREAYRLAAQGPSVEEYLEQLANPPEVEEPPKKRAKKASEKPAQRSSRGSLKSIKRKLQEPSEDVGEVGEVAAEDAIELKRPKQRGRPTASKEAEVANLEDLAASTELRAELCRQARIRLQKALLAGDPREANFTALTAILEQVEQVEVEVAIVRMSKLRRMLTVACSLEVEDKFRERCTQLLERWETSAEPVIRGLPEAEVDLEALKEREGVIERETEEPGTPASELEPASEAESKEPKEPKEPKEEEEPKEPKKPKELKEEEEPNEPNEPNEPKKEPNEEEEPNEPKEEPKTEEPKTEVNTSEASEAGNSEAGNTSKAGTTS